MTEYFKMLMLILGVHPAFVRRCHSDLPPWASPWEEGGVLGLGYP